MSSLNPIKIAYAEALDDAATYPSWTAATEVADRLAAVLPSSDVSVVPLSLDAHAVVVGRLPGVGTAYLKRMPREGGGA